MLFFSLKNFDVTCVVEGEPCQNNEQCARICETNGRGLCSNNVCVPDENVAPSRDMKKKSRISGLSRWSYPWNECISGMNYTKNDEHRGIYIVHWLITYTFPYMSVVYQRIVKGKNPSFFIIRSQDDLHSAHIQFTCK